jgi:hypothetical protein
MPNYDFINSDTNKVETHFIKISELDEFKANNPKLERVITAPAIISGSSIHLKNDDGWKEVLSKAAEGNPDTPLADRYGKRSAKDIKTKAVVDKHRKIQAEKNNG